ncbi:hypothetical protein ACSTS3_18125 [Aquimarina muelleri]|uniref:hypothetical protein n=1 Tax=Aquimarina muelleri TaxID=279356 RepID=UPI003F687B9A
MPIRISQTGNPSNHITIPHLNKPQLPGVVSFYRSKEHAMGNYGAKDTGYTGTFGFDRFDTKVMAEGMVNEYAVVAGVESQQKTVDGDHRHLCSYLSLYPPNANGNTTDAKVYVRLEPSKEFTNGDPDLGLIHFISSAPDSVAIAGANDNGAVTIMLTMGKQKDATHNAVAIGELQIECLQEFSTPVTITAKRITKETDKIVGQLIVYPNHERYTTTIQPVVLKLATAEGKTVGKIPNSPFLNTLVKACNTKSFNQSYIHAALAPHTNVITLSRSQLDQYLEDREGKLHLKNENTALQYNTMVESRYAALLVNQGQKNKAEEKVKEKGQKLLEVFDKKYNYNKDGIQQAKKGYDKKMVTTIWQHPKVQAAYTEYQQAKQSYGQLGGADTALDKTHKIHLFITQDIYGAYGDAAAYSATTSGIAHIFNLLLQDATAITGTLHEIGHSLGLEHTFSNDLGTTILKQDGVTYKQDVDSELDGLKDKLRRINDSIKSINKLNSNLDLTNSELSQLKTLKMFYFLIKKSLSNKTGFNKDVNLFDSSFLLYIRNTINIESNPLSIGTGGIKSIEELEKEINTTTQKIAELEVQQKTAVKGKELPKKKSKSTSLENYMDYTHTDSGSKNTTMQRKVFYQWQWDILRTTGKTHNYLKETK